MTYSYEEIDGIKVYYEKVGRGAQILLVIPGEKGTLRLHFREQLKGLDHDLFTFIGIDLPGWGKSRPPERKYYRYETHKTDDAIVATTLMERLGYKRYSVMGTCFGASIAIMVASMNPGRVDKLVVESVFPYFGEDLFSKIHSFRGTYPFNDEYIELAKTIYGSKETFDKVWYNELNFWSSLKGSGKKILDTRKEMTKIRCPVLIIQGDRDPWADKDPACYGIAEQLIPDSIMVRFPKGGHCTREDYPNEFNQLVTNFIHE